MATEITLSVPDQHVQTILNAFNNLAGKNIEIQAHDINGHWSFSFDAKDEEETNEQFAKRVIKELVRALVRLDDYADDYDRYRDEVAGLNPPSQDIPDGIIE